MPQPCGVIPGSMRLAAWLSTTRRSFEIPADFRPAPQPRPEPERLAARLGRPVKTVSRHRLSRRSRAGVAPKACPFAERSPAKPRRRRHPLPRPRIRSGLPQKAARARREASGWRRPRPEAPTRSARFDPLHVEQVEAASYPLHPNPAPEQRNGRRIDIESPPAAIVSLKHKKSPFAEKQSRFVMLRAARHE